jgi:membrane protease YdiL (CAAX protease family)
LIITSSYQDYSDIKGSGKNVFYFYLLAFLFAWMIWIPVLLSAYNIIPLKIPLQISLLAGLAPIGAGLYMAYREQGKTGLKDMLKRCIMVRFNVIFFLIAIILPALNIFIPLFVSGTLQIPSFTKWLPVYLMQLPFITVIAIFEEAGWRGFASPRLQNRFGKYPAAVLMGCLWSVWHWPYWLTPGLGFITNLSFDKTITALLLSLAGTVAFETQLTWLFTKVKGSLFFACLFHAAYNALWLALVNGTENKQINTTYIGPVVSILLALFLFLYDSFIKKQKSNKYVT